MTENQFTIASGPEYPLSFRLAILLIVAFLFVGMPLARRNKFPLLALSLPIWIGFIALFLSLGNAAAGQSVTVGGGRHAMAAGVAEAHIPLKWALYAVTFVSLLYSVRYRKTESSINLTCVVVLGLAFAAVAPLHVWFAQLLLDPVSVYEVRKVRTALSLAAVPAVALTVSVAYVIRGRGSEPRLSRTVAVISAASALAVGLALREVIGRLEQFAMSP